MWSPLHNHFRRHSRIHLDFTILTTTCFQFSNVEYLSFLRMSFKGQSHYVTDHLFILFCHIETSQPAAPPPFTPLALLVPLESPWCVRVHQGGFIMFGPMVQELLNFEVAHCKFNKWKRINSETLGGHIQNTIQVMSHRTFWNRVGYYGNSTNILERMGVRCWRVPCIILSWFLKKIPGGVGREGVRGEL